MCVTRVPQRTRLKNDSRGVNWARTCLPPNLSGYQAFLRSFFNHFQPCSTYLKGYLYHFENTDTVLTWRQYIDIGVAQTKGKGREQKQGFYWQ